MLEKIFIMCHVSNVFLQQQYRQCRFTKYSELISCLLVVEQNNELLMKNHKSHPIGSESFPKVNAISSQKRGRGCGRNSQYHAYDNNPSNSQKKESLISPPKMEKV